MMIRTNWVSTLNLNHYSGFVLSMLIISTFIDVRYIMMLFARFSVICLSCEKRMEEQDEKKNEMYYNREDRQVAIWENGTIICLTLSRIVIFHIPQKFLDIFDNLKRWDRDDLTNNSYANDTLINLCTYFCWLGDRASGRTSSFP